MHSGMGGNNNFNNIQQQFYGGQYSNINNYCHTDRNYNPSSNNNNYQTNIPNTHRNYNNYQNNNNNPQMSQRSHFNPMSNFNIMGDQSQVRRRNSGYQGRQMNKIEEINRNFYNNNISNQQQNNNYNNYQAQNSNQMPPQQFSNNHIPNQQYGNFNQNNNNNQQQYNNNQNNNEFNNNPNNKNDGNFGAQNNNEFNNNPNNVNDGNFGAQNNYEKKNSNPLLDYDSIGISESIKIEPEDNNQNENSKKNNDKNKNLPQLEDTLSSHLNKLKIDNNSNDQPENIGEIDFNLLESVQSIDNDDQNEDINQSNNKKVEDDDDMYSIKKMKNDSYFPGNEISESVQISNELPPDIHDHPLTDGPLSGEICTLCADKKTCDKGKKCNKCPLIICETCSQYITLYYNFKHDHPLYFLKEKNFNCSLCNKNLSDELLFKCKECNFGMCLKCFYPERK